MGFWGVMFQVNPGQAALLLAHNLELILVVVLRRLVDNEIKRQVAHTLAGYLTHVIRQVKGWSSAPVACSVRRSVPRATRIVRQPARLPASMSSRMSPTNQLDRRSSCKSLAACKSIPGAGLRQSQRLASPGTIPSGW